MEKNRGTKIIAIIALCIAVAGISLAYAAMSTTLTIKGGATVETATWDVHFANLTTSTTGAASFAEDGTPAIVGEKSTSIETFDAILTKPGDSVVMKFDVVNGGSLDADLYSYSLGTVGCTEGTDCTTVKGNIEYTLVYAADVTDAEGGVLHSTGDAVAQDDVLPAGKTAKMTLTLAYKSDATTLPAADVELTIGTTTLTYQQAD